MACKDINRLLAIVFIAVLGWTSTLLHDFACGNITLAADTEAGQSAPLRRSPYRVIAHSHSPLAKDDALALTQSMPRLDLQLLVAVFLLAALIASMDKLIAVTRARTSALARNLMLAPPPPLYIINRSILI